METLISNNTSTHEEGGRPGQNVNEANAGPSNSYPSTETRRKARAQVGGRAKEGGNNRIGRAVSELQNLGACQHGRESREGDKAIGTTLNGDLTARGMELEERSWRNMDTHTQSFSKTSRNGSEEEGHSDFESSVKWTPIIRVGLKKSKVAIEEGGDREVDPTGEEKEEGGEGERTARLHVHKKKKGDEEDKVAITGH